MAKHTGGLPWTAVPNEWDEVLPEEERGNDWYVVTENEVAIAVGLYKPDAHLIAAAPDLLAALKEAYRDMLPLTESDDPETHQMAERIRAAIAKAERS